MSDNFDNIERADKPFRWDAAREQAAELLAQNDLTGEQIAERLDISRGTLCNWKKHPEFAAKVEGYAATFAAEIRRTGVCDRINRLRGYQDRSRRMNRVIQQRAAEQGMENVPGGDTGLMVRTVKSIPSKEGPTQIDLWEVDTALLKAMLDLEKQAAIELGEWVEKDDVTSGGQVLKGYVGVSPDDWDREQTKQG